MYLRKEAKGTNFHVLLMRNTYGMQVKYVKGHYLTYKIIGGYFDFRFFLGDKYPETSIKLYHNYVNGYTLHPFWVQGMIIDRLIQMIAMLLELKGFINLDGDTIQRKKFIESSNNTIN